MWIKIYRQIVISFSALPKVLESWYLRCKNELKPTYNSNTSPLGLAFFVLEGRGLFFVFCQEALWILLRGFVVWWLAVRVSWLCRARSKNFLADAPAKEVSDHLPLVVRVMGGFTQKTGAPSVIRSNVGRAWPTAYSFGASRVLHVAPPNILIQPLYFYKYMLYSSREQKNTSW